MLPDPAPIIRTLIIVLINWVVRHQRCYKSMSTFCNIYHPHPHDVCKSPGPVIIIEIMRTCSSPFRHAAQSTSWGSRGALCCGHLVTLFCLHTPTSCSSQMLKYTYACLSKDTFKFKLSDHCIFSLYHFHTFLYSPSTLNPQPSTQVPWTQNLKYNALNPKP